MDYLNGSYSDEEFVNIIPSPQNVSKEDSNFQIKSTIRGRRKKESIDQLFVEEGHNKYSKDNLYSKVIRFLFLSIITDLQKINKENKLNYYFDYIFLGKHLKDFSIKKLSVLFDKKIENFISEYNLKNKNILSHILSEHKKKFTIILNMSLYEYYKDIYLCKLKTSNKYQGDFNLIFYAENTLIDIYKRQKKNESESNSKNEE